ncbi:small ribosomal subunit Rsm22 family protein [Bartonella tamiae]|uniref:Ribosomal small subunit Rsm22 n=1 Tax=Bartonella tamiae Th239 TaxID=1094558 RepID=J0R104_9HYPH|nr:small ribosomal subunit Rsm22 family protein [Bartonella tamiae]EJF89224.1 hypothetical protein ME5_01775 [Bartonella tamiae Th239]EJF95372.1 hypothetical protein MEG_00105 [Bartonella tamiae Th307]
MQLPADLKKAIDELLRNISLAKLEEESLRLSHRYRSELLDGTAHLNSAQAALAYVAARFPATYGAVFSVFNHVIHALPDFSPLTQLDVGSGPATAVLAAKALFPSINYAEMTDYSEPIQKIAQCLINQSFDYKTQWHLTSIQKIKNEDLNNADLVTLAYVLDELKESEQDQLIELLWQKTEHILIIVEPGTPNGWRRLMRQRQRLITWGGFVVAPCPHQNPCALAKPDWCHFSVRIERSRIHRQTKKADVPYEDEKYHYIAVSKFPIDHNHQRVLRRPLRSGRRVDLKLCLPNGDVKHEIVSKKETSRYHQARRCEWGDEIK